MITSDIYAANHIDDVLTEILTERRRQTEKWGSQKKQLGMGRDTDRIWLEIIRRIVSFAEASNTVTWREVLEEEVAEAHAESDEAKIRAELIQVAAVAVQIIEAIDAGQIVK